MVEAESPTGLSGEVALWRLLALRGVTAELQALVEALQSDFSPENLVQELGAQGLEARIVMVQVEDLDHLELPTLLNLEDGTWALVRERIAGGWRLEGEGGATVVPRERLAAVLAGPALDITRPLAPTGSLWSRMGQLLIRHRRLLGQAALITVSAQVLALLPPWLTGKVLDEALGGGVPSLLPILCLGLVLSALFQAWVGWLRETCLLAFTTRFDATLQKGLFDHLLHLPFAFFQGKTLGELLQSFTGLRRARTLLLDKGLGAVFSGISALLFLVYMAMLMPGPAAVVLLVGILFSVFAFAVGWLLAREQREEVQASQKEFSALVELLSGAATLKATASQAWALSRWATRLGKQLHHSLRRERYSLWTEGGNELLNLGLLSIVLVWGGRKVLAGEATLGNVLVFVQLSGAFSAALLALSQTALSALMLRPQIAAVRETFLTQRQPKAPRLDEKGPAGPLRVEGLGFRYSPKGPWILQGARLEVQPGTFHHVQGPSGSGKSTLLKLVAGLYAPETGSISIGGLDPLAAAPLMTLLPQFPQLFAGSMLENLRLFSGGADRSRLMEVAEDTGLDAWVGTLPMGYQTMVAQGGGNLSGGQRQLVAITGVLASRKQILLLDEAMSSMDWITRTRILRSRFFKGRTIVYASHEEILPAAEG